MNKRSRLWPPVCLCVLAAVLLVYRVGGEHRSSFARDIIADINVTMFGSLHAEEDFSSIVDGYGIPLDWVMYGAFPNTALDIAVVTNNAAETHARGLKYVHHIPLEKMYTDGKISLGDVKPELREFCIIDVDGNRSMSEFDGIGVYNMNLNEKGWQKYIKSEIRAAIDAGADGIVLDEIQTNTMHMGGPSGGVFNPVDIKGFRRFLKKTHSPQVLASRFGISNIGSFDYRKWILANGYRDTWLEVPWEVPLYSEFRWYVFDSVLKAEKKIIRWSKKYGQSKHKKDIVFLGNSSDGMAFSLPFEVNLDLAWCEYPYLWYGYPPLSKIIPSAKLRVDGRWKKGAYITQVPTNADLVARGDIPNISIVFWAEAYASQNEYNVPLNVPGSSTYGYNPDLSVLAPYYQFIDRYRAFYGSDWGWKPRIAIFYPVTSYLGIPDSYLGTALALFEGGIQFDVIFSGDGRVMKDKATLSMLQQYPVLLMANAKSMTPKQRNLVLDYVAKGGTALGWGGIGPEDEFGNDVTNLPSEWTAFWNVGSHKYVKGWFVNLSNGNLGEDYFRSRKPANRNRIIDGISPYAPPEIVSTAPDDVDFLVYANSANTKLAFHMINYRYNLSQDRIRQAKNFFVTVTLPDGFSLDGKKARLISPDQANPQNISLTQPGPATIRFKVPKLKYYNLFVIE